MVIKSENKGLGGREMVLYSFAFGYPIVTFLLKGHMWRTADKYNTSFGICISKGWKILTNNSRSVIMKYESIILKVS